MSSPAGAAEGVTWRLDNGVQVLVEPDPRAPLVAVVTLHPSGGAAGAPPGAAHLLEHLLLGPEVEREAALAGVSINAWTDLEALGSWSVGPPEALGEQLAIEARGLARPMAGVGEDDLAREAAVVDREQAEAEAGPGGGVARALAALAWPVGHPYRLGVIGQQADRSRLSLAELRALAESNAGPAGAVLVVIGDVDPEQARGLVEALIGAVLAQAGGASGAATWPVTEADLEGPPRARRWRSTCSPSCWAAAYGRGCRMASRCASGPITDPAVDCSGPRSEGCRRGAPRGWCRAASDSWRRGSLPRRSSIAPVPVVPQGSSVPRSPWSSAPGSRPHASPRAWRPAACQASSTPTSRWIPPRCRRLPAPGSGGRPSDR